VGELRNPHVRKHNNHLLGEVHALKLAIVANDSGVTEPLDSLTTPLGDLLYNDTVNPGDPCNHMKVRGIVSLVDSALTYCANFPSVSFYFQIDSCVSRINRAFDGPYVAESFHPLVLQGTRSLGEVYFLHATPLAAPVMRGHQTYSAADELPDHFTVSQNYPNPFNPQPPSSLTYRSRAS